MVAQALAKLVMNSAAKGIAKYKPLIIAVLSSLLTFILLFFDPGLVNKVLEYIISLF